MKLSLYKNKTSVSLFISFCIFLFVFFLSGFFYSFNKNIQNTYYSFRDTIFEKEANKNIVILEIDEKSLKNLWRFPFSRDAYIPVIKNLQEKETAVIAFDIIFADESDTEKDRALANAFKEAWNIVLGNARFDQGSVEAILPLFSNSVLREWYFSPLIETVNNTVYSFEPFFLGRDRNYYEHFSLSVLETFYNYKKEKKEFYPQYDNYFYILENNEKIKIPFSRKWEKEILINFIDTTNFQRLSFYDIYNKKNFDALNFDFKDKIVLIGATAKWIKDTFLTPNGVEYGVYIHANFINTVLNNDYTRYFDTNLERLLIFCLIVIAVYFNLSRRSSVIIWTNLALFWFFLVILPVFIIAYTSIIINYPSEILFSLFLSLIISNIVKYMLENKEKTKLNKALAQYVSEDIAKRILSEEGTNLLDKGETKRVAIFFSDIEGFTSISERFWAKELVAFLKKYLSEMSNIILTERGFINKYEWDAIMALWWIFSFEESSSYDACLSALKQQKKLEDLNKIWKKEYKEELYVRMWIHIGDAIIGNIWLEWRKIEFTALWDAVNLASRLEGVNKFYGTNICVSEDIYDEQKENFVFRFLDTIRVKGKKKAGRIYELVDLKEEIDKEKILILLDFQKALELYTKKSFKEAWMYFSRLAKSWDWPSKTYKERCDFYIQNPPEENWDGVWELREK